MQRVIHNKHMNEHHAILIFADSLALSGIPDAYLEQGADVLHLIKDRFGIDDARELSEQASQTPFASSVRVFVIATNDVAVEAQNALLKLLEEPPQHARFYLILPPGSFLLPTLRSRLYEQEHTRTQEDVSSTYTAFKNASYGERLARIAEWTKNKDTAAVESILRGCEQEVQVEGAEKNEKLLQSVLFVRNYSGSRGASLKMLLEELALSLRV